MSISLKFSALVVAITFALAGCAPSTDYSSGRDSLPEPTVELDTGEKGGAIESPSVESPQEESESSDAAWEEFYAIVVNSGDSFLTAGAVEYYEMFEDAPYLMISVPDSKLGSFWNVYSDLKNDTYYLSFNAFLMSPLRAYLDLMSAQGDKELAKTLSKVSKNEDNTFTVTNLETEGKQRYKVQGGYISGLAVFAEGGLFLGYSSVYYETNADLLVRVNQVYQSGLDAEEEFIATPEENALKSLFVAVE